MKKLTTVITTILILIAATSYAQFAINEDGTAPDASAILDVKSTDKGFLPPRVDNVYDVSNPVAGLLVYDQSASCMRFYDGTQWSLCAGSSSTTFSCGTPFADSRDGKIYNSVQIGTQCWMAENLNIGEMVNGSIDQADDATIEKYCYGNSTSNCDTYGGLYQWNEMMDYDTTESTQGICPSGWHLPSDAEWCTLEQEVDSTITCSSTGWRGVDGGGKLKESGTTHWTSTNTGATNSSGFTGLPGGYRLVGGSFDSTGDLAGFWSSSVGGSSAWYRSLGYGYARVGRSYGSQAYGFSARCVRDDY